MMIAAEALAVDHPEPTTRLAFQFDCCECGRSFLDKTPQAARSIFAFCAPCVSRPGWFRDPGLRRIIDPAHDGREVCERQNPDQSR